MGRPRNIYMKRASSELRAVFFAERTEILTEWTEPQLEPTETRDKRTETAIERTDLGLFTYKNEKNPLSWFISPT